MTLTLPNGHTLHLRTSADGGSSWTEVALDDGPWTPSKVASLHKVLHRFLDIPASDIAAAWEEVTGEHVGHICEGCGRRRIDARVVSGSDCYWCGECR